MHAQRLRGPEVEAVDAGVPEPDRQVVRMVGRPGLRDYVALHGPYRIDVRAVQPLLHRGQIASVGVDLQLGLTLEYLVGGHGRPRRCGLIRGSLRKWPLTGSGRVPGESAHATSTHYADKASQALIVRSGGSDDGPPVTEAGCVRGGTNRRDGGGGAGHGGGRPAHGGWRGPTSGATSPFSCSLVCSWEWCSTSFRWWLAVWGPANSSSRCSQRARTWGRC